MAEGEPSFQGGSFVEITTLNHVVENQRHNVL